MPIDFVNPYSFIRTKAEAPDRVEPAAARGTLSGYIDCSLEIASPTFIPNTTGVFEETVQVEKKNGDTAEAQHPHRVFNSYRDLSGEKALTDEIRLPADPVIPGSELRGMVRSLYETLTNSCYSQIDEFNLPYKRTPEPKVLCLMFFDEATGRWMIYPEASLRRRKGEEPGFGYAKGIITFDRGRPKFRQTSWHEAGLGKFEIKDAFRETYRFFRFGESCRVRLQADGTLAKDENGPYYLHMPTMMATKTQPDRKDTANRFVLYAAKGGANALNGKGYPLPDDAVTRFERVIGCDADVKGGYTDDVVNQNADSLKLSRYYRERYEKHEPLVVYADKNSVALNFTNPVIYLSSASMTKEFFGNTVLDVLKKNHQHQPCRDKRSACPACRLFGMVGDEGAVMGRLRFFDSHAVAPVTYGPEVTLDILGTPKISSTEFYLLPPKGWRSGDKDAPGTWNYDYSVRYLKVFDQKKRKNETVFQRDTDTYQPRLAGRKIYWNRDFSYVSAAKTNMNATVTPITAGEFGFRVRFDSLTRNELEKLLFCLQLQDDAGTVHKIGGGKPLGLGQCRVKVLAVRQETYETADGHIRKSEQPLAVDASAVYADPDAAPILIASRDLPANEKAVIDYPRPEDCNDIFKWFSNNRGSVGEPRIVQILPPLTGSAHTLEKNNRDSHKNNGGGNGGSGGYGNRGGNNGSGNRGGSGGNSGASQPLAAPAPQLRNAPACKNCGKPVDMINPSTGKPGTYCKACLAEIRKKKESGNS